MEKAVISGKINFKNNSAKSVFAPIEAKKINRKFQQRRLECGFEHRNPFLKIFRQSKILQKRAFCVNKRTGAKSGCGFELSGLENL